MIEKAKRPGHLRLVLTELSAISGVESSVFLDLSPATEPPHSVLWNEFTTALLEGVSVFFSPFMGIQKAFKSKTDSTRNGSWPGIEAEGGDA